jgi:hypothetical protein
MDYWLNEKPKFLFMFRREPFVSPCYILGLNLLFLSLQLIKITLMDFNVLLVLPTWIRCSVTTFLTDVSMWLSSFYKAILPVINDLWVVKLWKAHVLFVVGFSITLQEQWMWSNSQILWDLRLIPQYQRLINLLHFDDSILFTKIDLADPGAQVLVHSKNGH